jgi:2-keto-4-pentenoate hydratase/2-oxohepta-3-ene-1,7-dioic acid hydratase in catechol pathway
MLGDYAGERAGHLAKGRIWLSVNGKVRQDADLDPMIWKVAHPSLRASSPARSS